MNRSSLSQQPNNKIIEQLQAVTKRLWIQKGANSMFTGLFIANSLAILSLLAAWFWDNTVLTSFYWIIIGICMTGGISGLVMGLFFPFSLRIAAIMIDRHYQLNERVLTSWEILKKPVLNKMELLQLSDTQAALHLVVPSEIVVYHRPRYFFRTGMLCFILILLFAGTIIFPKKREIISHSTNDYSSTDIQPTQTITQPNMIHKRIAEQLKTVILDPLSIYHSSPATPDLTLSSSEAKWLAELLEHLRDCLTSFSQATTITQQDFTTREALAALTQMQEAIQKAIASNQSEQRESLVKKEEYHGRHPEILQQLRKNLTLLEYCKWEYAESLRQMNNQLSHSPSLPPAEQMERNEDASNGKQNKNKNQNHYPENSSSQSSENWGANPRGNESQITMPPENFLLDSIKSDIPESISGIRGAGPSVREILPLLSTIDKVSRQTPSTAESTEKYQNHLREYREQEEQIVESENIPLGKRLLIRNYFNVIH